MSLNKLDELVSEYSDWDKESKKLKAKLEDIKSKTDLLKAKIGTELNKNDLTSYKVETIGSFTRTSGFIKRSVNFQKLNESMLSRGLDLKVIKMIQEDCVKVTKVEGGVKFYPVRVKEDE